MLRRTLIKNAAIAGGMMTIAPLTANCYTPDENHFPLIDLHVHTTSKFTIDNIMGHCEKKKCAVWYCGTSCPLGYQNRC